MAAKERLSKPEAKKQPQPSDGTRQVKPWKAEWRDTERKNDPYYKGGKG